VKYRIEAMTSAAVLAEQVFSITGQHQAGEDLNATLQMTGGNTFKIIALTFYSTNKTQGLKTTLKHFYLYCCTRA
jgi:hypothetical protein